MEDKEQMTKRKVQIIAPAYYARKEVQEAIFNFCKYRETVPRYLEGFGKRPDVLDYPSDVMSLVKKGATSFHCSEEIWSDPLKINVDMTPESYNEIRTGWDFLIDIDSKFLDYSKIAAQVLIQALESHGVKNIGIKFSGSKGFHIIIPFKSFPEELYGEKTKDKFPEWPRAIAGYLKEITKEKVNERIIGLTGKEKLKEKGELVERICCAVCKNEIIPREEDLFECTNPRCGDKLYFKKNRRKEPRCPNCNFNMNLIRTEKRYFCETCKKYKAHTKEDKELIKRVIPLNEQKNYETPQEQTTKSQEDSVDLVLVAPRHLFRAPYSLHEKTALVSCVLNKDELASFQLTDADPLKIKIRNYNPEVKKEEAKNLLLQAIDWAKKKTPQEEKKKYGGATLDLKGLKITEDMFPDVIKKILVGKRQDGRKRALSILISFYTSLEMPKDYIEEKIYEWNKKNKPLKDGYVRSQIEWGVKHKRLPPNYDKPIYREIVPEGFDIAGLKNPINYTIREAMRAKGREDNKKQKS
ncbi:Uncharacterised protein [uncultured archaeon]|nr:Uncharacterised protein [uncultured archaeon]